MRKAAKLFNDETLDRLKRTRLENCAFEMRDYEAKRWDEELHGGYTGGELEAAFKMVADPEDWRASIDSHVSPNYDDVVTSAVAFFTGADVRTESYQHEQWGPMVRVRCVGYRNGPCGP
jgi:hypothetical protein